MLSLFKQEWRTFLLALGFFTRIPVPSFTDFQETDLNHSVKYFPLIGILIGVVGAASFYSMQLFLPQAIAILTSMAVTIYLTGALHEDGLADSADGLGGGWEREQILTIMQDSRLGTYGAIALFLMLLSKFQVLSAMPPVFVAILLVVGHALSRLSAVWLMATASYVKSAGKAKPMATKLNIQQLIIANIFGWLPLLIISVLFVNDAHMMGAKFLLFTLLPVIAAWLWWRTKLIKKLGGYTGDTLGAMQQMSELVFYMGALAWSTPW